MKPSEKAIEAVIKKVSRGFREDSKIDIVLRQLAVHHVLIEAIESAYAIDVDPLLEQKDKEIERLKVHINEWLTISKQGNERISDLEQEVDALKQANDGWRSLSKRMGYVAANGTEHLAAKRANRIAELEQENAKLKSYLRDYFTEDDIKLMTP